MPIRLLRHAESHEGDGVGIDCGLTEEGKRQASRLSGHYDLLVLSPMKRCLETVYCSKIKANRTISSDLVREYRISGCDFLDDEPMVCETEDELVARVDRFKALLKEYSEEFNTILVVSHADFIWYLTKKDIGEGNMVGKCTQHCEIIGYL